MKLTMILSAALATALLFSQPNTGRTDLTDLERIELLNWAKTSREFFMKAVKAKQDYDAHEKLRTDRIAELQKLHHAENCPLVEGFTWGECSSVVVKPKGPAK